MRTMFMDDVPDGDTTPVKVPVALSAAVGLTLAATLLVGVMPNLVADLADHATFTLSLGL